MSVCLFNRKLQKAYFIFTWLLICIYPHPSLSLFLRWAQGLCSSSGSRHAPVWHAYLSKWLHLWWEYRTRVRCSAAYLYMLKMLPWILLSWKWKELFPHLWNTALANMHMLKMPKCYSQHCGMKCSSIKRFSTVLITSVKAWTFILLSA